MKHEFELYREDKDISQEALGKALGVSGGYISHIEKGKRAPSGKVMAKFDRLKSGLECLIPLTPQESKLLDEGVSKSNCSNREEYLEHALFHILKHDNFDIPVLNQNQPSPPFSIAAEEEEPYGQVTPLHPAQEANEEDNEKGENSAS